MLEKKLKIKQENNFKNILKISFYIKKKPKICNNNTKPPPLLASKIKAQIKKRLYKKNTFFV